MNLYECRICGEPSPRKFCSKDHYRPCKQCKKDYLVKKVVSPPEFCSSTCSARFRHQNNFSEKNCTLCGETFTSTNGNAKVCLKPHYKDCLGCKKAFLITNPSRIRDYCSWLCSATSKSYEKTCKRCSLPFSTMDSKVIYCERDHFSKCEGCGKDIFLRLAKRTTRFCSVSCASKNNKYENICRLCGKTFVSGKSNAKFCKGKHTKLCAACNEEYVITDPYQISQTCSPQCAISITDFVSSNQKREKTLLEKYGITNSYLIPHVIEKNRASSSRTSKINYSWKEKLEGKSGLIFSIEVCFAGQKYADLGYGDILLDVNPAISHNSSESFLHLIKRCKTKGCKDKQHLARNEGYHHDRFLAAEKDGKTLLQYFDWMDEEIFISIVRSKLHLDENKVYAKRCEVKEISQREANKFLQVNHLLGANKGQTFCVGIFYQDELVHVNTYGPARLNKNFEWEAIRSCSKMNWHVQGGLQKADAFFIKSKVPKSIISYVDLALGGGVAEAQNPGWKLRSTNPPSATWVFLGRTGTLDGKPPFVSAASARKLSADKLLGFEVGSKYPTHYPDGTVFTNDDVLLAEGYVKVFDVGTRTFVWRAEAGS